MDLAAVVASHAGVSMLLSLQGMLALWIRLCIMAGCGKANASSARGHCLVATSAFSGPMAIEDEPPIVARMLRLPPPPHEDELDEEKEDIEDHMQRTPPPLWELRLDEEEEDEEEEDDGSDHGERLLPSSNGWHFKDVRYRILTKQHVSSH